MTEFFRVRTVAEALESFRPAHRVGVESVPVERGGGRTLARDIVGAHPLPGFARSTVDGFAVRATDTFGASESLPAYLEILGAVEMGAIAQIAVTTGTTLDVPTGGALPEGADAVVMVEHTSRAGSDRVEVMRPVAPGENVVGPDEDARPGDVLAPCGRSLRPQDAGMLAAAGVVGVEVWRRPSVAIVSTGDEVVPVDTDVLAPGRVRDANAPALALLVEELGGEPVLHGIVPDDPLALESTCRAALADADVLVVSAGSSVGTRDATGDVVSRLGEPGIWCHGLAVKPGKPTLLADVGGKPVIGLPGNPLSALVVMRLVGGNVVALVGGRSAPELSRRPARLARNVASATGRFDVVQVRLSGDDAHPIFGRSAQLSVLTAADGFITIADAVQGLAKGSDVVVECYR
jgi:molybdopterin molybdotransferase